MSRKRCAIRNKAGITLFISSAPAGAFFISQLRYFHEQTKFGYFLFIFKKRPKRLKMRHRLF
ncbi:unknown protein [Cronobacter turicensis z3032]|uniref:Uncharacterized protein n=1 Tax=Cronobacter turicensis (strain DSM 18703 / CCUG 55852 / LMG 23827 / z3032) TaxID=693216 RepID=C9XUW3_CROTZ|nr:unknown protein [Cronobacter turicensis z3032]